jgi:hypothetical protein
MKKSIFLILMFLILHQSSKSQNISPTELLQLNKNWQMNDPDCGKYTHQYLKSIDAKWAMQGPPQRDKDNRGMTIMWCYSKDGKTWFHPAECNILASLDYGTPDKKSILYTFTDVETWTLYNKQMEIMNAIKLGNGASDGGYQTTYKVNDIAFILTEFPPGINGVERSYRVAILRAD